MTHEAKLKRTILCVAVVSLVWCTALLVGMTLVLLRRAGDVNRELLHIACENVGLFQRFLLGIW